MASSTFDGMCCSNVGIIRADVSGFAQIKMGRSTDYAFVVEIEWTDGRKRFLKRTYSDFVNLQYKLAKTFQSDIKQQRSRNGKYLTGLPGRKRLFQRNDDRLAESREPELHQFIQDILKLPDKISKSSLVLSFFESWKGDPQPFTVRDEDGDNCNQGNDDDDDGYFLDLTELMLSEDLQDNQMLDSNAIWGSDVDRVPKLLRSSFSDLTAMYDPYYLGDFESVNEEDSGDEEEEVDKESDNDGYAYSEPGCDYSVRSAPGSTFSVNTIPRNSYSMYNITSEFGVTSQTSRMSIGSDSSESMGTTCTTSSTESIDT